MMPRMSSVHTWHGRHGGTDKTAYRLTQYAHGGGCACKIPPGSSSRSSRGLPQVGVARPARGARARRRRRRGPGRGRAGGHQHRRLLHPGRRRRLRLGPDRGGERVVRRLRDGRSAGRRDQPGGLAPRRVADGAAAPRCCAAAPTSARRGRARSPAVTASTTPSRKYGLAVTGAGRPDRILRNDAARPGLPISLTKPLGVGVLEQPAQGHGRGLPAGGGLDGGAQRHGGPRTRWRPGIEAATDVTGFGLLGPPVQDGARLGRERGRRCCGRALPRRRAGGAAGRLRQRRDPAQPRVGAPATRRSALGEDELLLLADAQTSGGLLVVGEVPGAPVIGEIVPRREWALEVR